MIKKLITLGLFGVLLLTNNVSAEKLIYNTSGTNSFGEEFIPAEYRPWYPTNQSKVGLKSSGETKQAIEIDGSKSYLYNVLAFNTQGLENSYSLTPGYNTQSYLIFPKDLKGNFGDISLQIKDLQFPNTLWNKLRPIVNLTYYDINNTPILDYYDSATDRYLIDDMWAGYQRFFDDSGNPTIYSSDKIKPVSCGSDGFTVDKAWCKNNKPESSPGIGSYNMSLYLPLSRLSNRTEVKDYDAQKSGEVVYGAKLKYIKVKISLVSLVNKNINENPTQSSYLKCGALREDTLQGYIDNSKINIGQKAETKWNNSPFSYGFTLEGDYENTKVTSEEKTLKDLKDKRVLSIKDGLVFNNGTKYNINSLISYFGLFTRPIVGGKELPISEIIKNNLAIVKAGDLDINGRPTFSGQYGNRKLIAEEPERLTSRRQIQDQISLRVTNLNNDIKSIIQFPTVVMEGGVITQTIRQPFPLTSLTGGESYADFLRGILVDYTYNIETGDFGKKVLKRDDNTPTNLFEMTKKFIDDFNLIPESTPIDKSIKADILSLYISKINDIIKETTVGRELLKPITNKEKPNLTISNLNGFVIFYNPYYYEELSFTENKVKSQNEELTFLYRPLIIKNDFALEDCTKLYIKNQTDPNKRKKYWRPEDNSNLYPFMDNDDIDDNIIYRPYSIGQGFGYTPYGVDSDFMNKKSSFEYLFGFREIQSAKYNGIGEETYVKELGLPDLAGGAPSYNWKENAPVSNYYSVGSGVQGVGDNNEVYKSKVEKLKKYCSAITQTEEDTNNCIKSHIPIGTGGIQTQNNYGQFNYFSLFDLGLSYDAILNEDPKYRSLIEENFSSPKKYLSLSPVYFTDSAKIFNWLYIPDEGNILSRTLHLGTKEVGTEKGMFLGAIPNSIIKELELNKPTGTEERVDQSFTWQTIYPFDNDLKEISGVQESPGLSALGYNITIPSGERYLKLGTYDLDKKENGGIPSLDIEFLIRPVFEDKTLPKNSTDRNQFGPPVIRIGKSFGNDGLNGLLDREIKIGKKNFYDESTGKYTGDGNKGMYETTSDIVDFTHGYSSVIKSGVNTSKVLQLPGPEGNNSTSFQKIDLYKLKEEITKAWCPDKTDTSNTRCKDLIYLDNWIFDDKTKRLKTNITLRFVIRNPDWGSSTRRKPNILYITSNGLVGPVPEPQLTNDNENSNIILLSSKKVVETSGIGKSIYYSSPKDISGNKDNIIKFTGTDSERSDILTFRVYQNEDPTKFLVNPYLTLPLNENANIEKLTSEEVADLKKISVTESEKLEGIDYFTNPNYSSYSDLGDLEGRDTLLVGEDSVKYIKNGKTYKKICIGSEDTNEQYYTPSTSGLFTLKKVVSGISVDVDTTIPHQLVCFYRTGTDGKTDADLRASTDLRRLGIVSADTPFDGEVLPFVDISVKVKTNSTKNVTKYYDAKNIVKGTITNCLYDNYDNPYNITNINSNLPTIQSVQSTCFKNNGSVIGTLDRFIEKTYDSTYSIPENERINLNFIKWADKLGEEDYNNISEEKKLNTVAFSLRYPNRASCTTGCEGITAKWDYPKTKLENPPGNPIKKQDPDQPDDPDSKKNIGDIVTVYPKITNTSDKDICNLVVSTKVNQQISNITSGDSQDITDNNIIFADSTNKLRAGETISWDGTLQNDISNGKQAKYKYKLTGENNNFGYLVKYKYCGEESGAYREEESLPISFAVNSSGTGLGAGLCNLNATLPAGNSEVTRGSTINYNITCTNTTPNDIYDLQIKLPTPDKIVYKTGIKEEYIPLGSLPKGETISYQTNPLDLVKRGVVAENSYNNEEIEGLLYSRYKNEEGAPSYVEGVDSIKHIVKVEKEDKVVSTVLRGTCDDRNEYPYIGGAGQQYPYKPLPGMCALKLPSTNGVFTNDNKGCLVIRYYRLGRDTLVSTTPYNNPHPDLSYNLGIKIDGITNNLVPKSKTNWLSCSRETSSLYREWPSPNTGCRNQNQTASSGDGEEGSVRSKYINVKVDTVVDIPSSFQVDPSATTKVFTDYTASPSIESISVLDATNDIRKYRVAFANGTITTEGQVSNNDFQKVLRDGASSNVSTLEKALIELRIPLLAKSKGSDSTDTTRNYFGETVGDSQAVKVLSSQIFFDRQRWLSKDENVQCKEVYEEGSSTNCSRGIYRWELIRDRTTTDVWIPPTTGLSFPAANPNSIPVCVSSDGRWFQVLNGGMYVQDLDGVQDIEHQIQLGNPASYNTNWFLNQDNANLLPGGFLQHNGGSDNLFNLDQKYNTTSCYPYNSQLNEYDYSSPMSVDPVTEKCQDGKYPRFYAIKNGQYGYNYKFSKTQLQGLLTTGINLNKGSASEPNIKDRIWVYSQVDNDNQSLVIGKLGVPKVEVEGLGSIFVTRDINNLTVKDAPYDKTHPENLSVILNINSNIIYKTNTITTGATTKDINGDSLAVVVNGNMKIGSQVEKLDGTYFVDGDVIIEESRNTLEIGNLFVTGKVIVRRKATTNSQIDRFTNTQDRPVLRITGDKKRSFFLQPKILQEPTKYYKEFDIEANDLNSDCKLNGSC